MVKAHGLAVGALLAWALCAAQPAMGQDPVDGVCHDSVRNGCSAGTPNDAALADTSNAYKWRCDGLHGGRDSRICFIRVEDVVDGVCDESRRNGCSAGTPNAAAYPDEPVVYQWRCDGLGGGRNSGRCALWFSVVGVCDESVRNGCSAGNPNADAFPDSSTEYAWRCDGLNAGANSGRCSRHVPVDGACDDGARNGCSAGTANDDAVADTSNAYLWRCDGLYGGSNSDKCHMFKPVNGVCNDSVRNGCSAGVPNDDAFPDAGSGGFVWRCDGEHGGRNSSKCFIRSVDGVCDDSVRNGCSAGTPNDAAIADTANAYLWRCDGLHGGADSEKCHKFIPVDGVCDESVRNGCSAGTANDGAVPDSSNAHLWRCDGLHGGADSEKCFKFIPVDGACDDSIRNGCAAGTANDAAIPDSSNAYLWRCDGLHGGANSEKCLKSMAVDGACDESVRNGCSAGTANDAAIADTSSAYLWRCDGLHGGANSERCRKFIPVNGACDESVRNGCSAGTANDDAVADTSSAYLWRCDGLHGGTNSERCRKSIPVNGACDESVRNGCSAGTANDAAVADTASHYQWRCDGSNGGSNSGVCSAQKPVAQVTCGTAPWSPATTTVCTGQSFTQTRTCNAGCNTGDCATSRSASGAKSCIRCGASWSPATSTICSGRPFTQTRTCNAGCNTGDCSTSRGATGTQYCVDRIGCGTAPWSAWSPDPSTQACDAVFTQTSTRDCNAGCNTGNCEETEQRLARGTQPRDCQWGPWGNCNCTPSTTDASNAGTQSRSQAVAPGCGGAPCTGSSRSCTVAANNCPVVPVCGTCNCTPSIFDDANAGTCSNGGAACTVPGGGCPVCGDCDCTASIFDAATAGTCSNGGAACTVPGGGCPVCGACGCTPSVFDPASAGVCRDGTTACTVSPPSCRVCGTCNCTRSTSDGTSAGVCSISGASCTVSANNCTVSCGAPWPSTPTGTSSEGWDCFGSGSHASYCQWGRDVYRRDCAEGCNDGDCSEVRTGHRRVIGGCHTNHPRCR